MKITVDLQKEYDYVIWPVIAVIIAAIVCVVIVILIEKSKTKVKNTTPDVTKAWQALGYDQKNMLRMKYLRLLDELQQKIMSNQISVRECYQLLSKYVRDFITEISGVNVNKKTLDDIKRMNMPALASLIEELYQVEFAKVSEGDATMAIAKTKRIIEIWN